MKKKSLIYGLIACLGFSAVSCEDMLSPDSERHSYEVAQDTMYSYWGIVRSMQNIAERYVLLGELRGDLVRGTYYLSDSIENILNYDMASATDGSNRYLKAADYYHVINSCNAYLASYDSTRTTGTLTPYMKKEAAQVSAIRAWTYLQLVQVYGKVPFYTQPLLTSDAINNFAKNPVKVDIDNLADTLVNELEAAAKIEAEFGFPTYNNYGITSSVAHSSKLMIPINIILGDLFLAKGDAQSCEKAAQYYYNYLSGNKNRTMIPAGGVIPAGYCYAGYQPEGEAAPRYISFGYTGNGGGTPWTEKGQQARTMEAITAIPSSTNKLWGTVLRGVNEIYGFDTYISVHTSGSDTASSTSASVSLSAQYDKKQIINSQAYSKLAMDQQFEYYYGSSSRAQSTWTLDVDPKVGDARQYWLRDYYQSYSNGTMNTEKFISKQNPGGSFTTTFPMIYRKSQVWLRFAEALCNAGYPSYAFAILKDGLCNAEGWLPGEGRTDYEWKAWIFNRSKVGADNKKVVIAQYPNEEYPEVKNKTDLINQLIANMEIASDKAKRDSIAMLQAEIDSTATEWYNWPNPENVNLVVNYISFDEKEKNAPFLDFTPATFDGNNTRQVLFLRPSPYDDDYSILSEELSYGKFTNGIHSRGTGYLMKTDRHKSKFNYVDMVTKKAKENYGKDLTKEDIYDYSDAETQQIVKWCVEDLIVDEEALELAFEGSRFFDLMRVAHRRGTPEYLANKVAERNPEEPNEALRAKLKNPNNWYFPLPNE